MSSNGAYLTSQLPVTTNAVPTDRVLVLWNAIANVSVGSGTPQTMMITMSDFVNNALGTIESDIMSGGTLSLGNSTVNTVVNSTAFLIQTNLGTKFTVNTSGVIVGNGAGITSLPAPGSNTQVIFNNSGTIVAAANLTWNGVTLTVGNSETNTTVNSSVFVNGNTYINSTFLSVGNAGTVLVGNVTHNVSITSQSIAVSNNGNTVWSVGGTGQGLLQSTTAKLTVSNSTVNSTLSSISLGIYANNTVNATLNAISVNFNSNSTANAIFANTGLIFNSNATVNSSLSATALSIANSTATLSLDPSSFNVVNTAAGGTFNLPGGWHIAFGLVQTNSIGSNSITFANAFNTNAYGVTTQVLLAGAANSFAASVVDRAHINSVSKSGFTLWTGNTTANASANVYYMAIGF